jgi:hypothetical protein
MENVWSTLKIKLVHRTAYRTRDEANNAIFAYVDGWSGPAASRKSWAGSAQTSTRPPGTPAKPAKEKQLSSGLSQPTPGNQPSEKRGPQTDASPTWQHTSATTLLRSCVAVVWKVKDTASSAGLVSRSPPLSKDGARL